MVELQPGDEVYDQVNDRGLFFIEEGVLVSVGQRHGTKILIIYMLANSCSLLGQKIERERHMTVSRVGGEAFSRLTDNHGTFNDLKARTGSIGRAVAELKAGEPLSMKPNFRIARSKDPENK